MTTTEAQREALIHRVMGPSIPRLWCPPLTHYTADGGIDAERMAAHWRTMVDHVGGFLVPGSTGDGWEMTKEEIAEVLDLAIDLAIDLDTRLLVGVLRTDVDAMEAVITDVVERLRGRSEEDQDVTKLLGAHHVIGFTVCPPAGRDLTQMEIEAALTRILEIDLPTALYQLPQVTGNEISPAVFRSLAKRYANLLMLKDSSGQDHVAVADKGESGVFLVRGAEGDYAEWLVETGGRYQGLLLSTANCFAEELHHMIESLEAGAVDAAIAKSRHLTQVVNAVFAAVAGLEHGNAFSNANRAVDHFLAYGPDATTIAPPMCYGGARLPETVIARVGEILESHGFMPEAGYLAQR